MTRSLASVGRNGGRVMAIETIIRRLKSQSKGLGYWAAVDALTHLDAGDAKLVMRRVNSKEEQ